MTTPTLTARTADRLGALPYLALGISVFDANTPGRVGYGVLGPIVGHTEDGRPVFLAKATGEYDEDEMPLYRGWTVLSVVRHEVGKRVEAGNCPADYDTGVIQAVFEDGAVRIGWDSGVAIRIPAAMAARLRPEGERPYLDSSTDFWMF